MACDSALRKRDVHAALHHRRGDHEDDEQQQHDVDQAHDVDVGIELETVTTRDGAPCQMRPSRTSSAITAVPKLSIRPSNRFSLLAKML